jgi:hypothetical protein
VSLDFFSERKCGPIDDRSIDLVLILRQHPQAPEKAFFQFSESYKTLVCLRYGSGLEGLMEWYLDLCDIVRATGEDYNPSAYMSIIRKAGETQFLKMTETIDAILQSP